MLTSAISIPIISASKISPRNILNFIQKLLRSGEYSWIFDGSMLVTLTIIRTPRGRGHVSVTKNPREFRAADRYKAMKGVVTIETSPHDPENNLCCARAIVVSISKFSDDKKLYDEMRRSLRSRQSEAARRLHQEADVPLGPYDLAEIEKFQQFLATRNIQLMAINVNANGQAMNDSPQFRKLGLHLVRQWPSSCSHQTTPHGGKRFSL